MEQQRSEDTAQDGADASKRKKGGGDDNPRAKRSRYIAIACHECKRRKIRCNGEDPCERCAGLSILCAYATKCEHDFKDTVDVRQMKSQITALQDQVETLFHSICSLRHDSQLAADSALPIPRGAEPYRRPQRRVENKPPKLPMGPRFKGPTSSAFSFGVAQTSLNKMGIAESDIGAEETVTTVEPNPSDSPGLQSIPLQSIRNPMWTIGKDEAVRLCRFYEEQMGIMYPILDIEDVVEHACKLYDENAEDGRAGLDWIGDYGVLMSEDVDTDILLVIMATALVTEGAGKSALGGKLFGIACVKDKTRLPGLVDINGVRVLILKAMYYFHMYDEGMAWRMIGVTARICVELGLHRSRTYPEMFDNDKDRMAAIKLFWSVYVLDRRWSFGTGMPFAIADGDIEADMPQPDESSTYLGSMVAYSKIASKAWSSIISNCSPNEPNWIFNQIVIEQVRYLDFQISAWQKDLPADLQYDKTQHERTKNTAGYRLQVILYLRANQMRILIYRPALYSATSSLSAATRQFAQNAVDVAKDTISTLTKLNRESDIYRSQQVSFHHFLMSALAVIFLAVSHAPAQFSAQCRLEFYMALDLVRELSAASHVSKKLWKTIRGLKEVGPKLGLHAQEQNELGGANLSTQTDAQSSAAMAMVGLAGQWIDDNHFFESPPNPSNAVHRGGVEVNSPSVPDVSMADELTEMFEAAVGYGNYGPGGMRAHRRPSPSSGHTQSQVQQESSDGSHLNSWKWDKLR